jgi:hypothetical protein
LTAAETLAVGAVLFRRSIASSYELFMFLPQ